MTHWEQKVIEFDFSFGLFEGTFAHRERNNERKHIDKNRKDIEFCNEGYELLGSFLPYRQKHLVTEE